MSHHYNLVDFGEMLNDKVRLDAFTQALQELAPGQTILEIGGGTGYFACLAARFGATQVISLDYNPLIELGEKIAESNEVTNVTFVQADSRQYEIDEKADLLLHDMRGPTPFWQDSLSIVQNAQERLLKKNAIMLPKRDVLYACLVDDKPFYDQMEGVWGQKLGEIDLRAFRTSSHRRMKYFPSPQVQRWPEEVIGEIDYGRIESTSLSHEWVMEAPHSGVTHGLCIWFESFLTDEISLSTSPWLDAEERSGIYGVTFLPWPEPVEIDDDHDYILRVNIDCLGSVSASLREDCGHYSNHIAKFSEISSQRLPLAGRFSSNEAAQHCELAFELLNREESVEKALIELREQFSDLSESAAAFNLLNKCLGAASSSLKKPEPVTQDLQYRDVKVRFQAWDSALLADMTQALEPSWTPTREELEDKTTTITLEMTLTPQGTRYLTRTDELLFEAETLEGALSNLRAAAVEVLAEHASDFLVLDCGYAVQQNAVTLVFDEDLDSRRAAIEALPDLLGFNARVCLLDLSGRVLPYITGGQTQSVRTPEVDGLQMQGLPASSPAIALMTLVGKCRNPETLTDSLAYFRGLMGS